MRRLVGDGGRALVTGASSGIGEAIARGVAAQGGALVLVARSSDRLEALASELRARHGVAVEVMALDLSRPEAPEELLARTEARGTRVDLLVNAAGFGLNAPEAELPVERVLELLRLNVVAAAELTHRFLVAMRARGSGSILNVASTAGFLPGPYFAAYAASKAFLVSFTQALHEEAKPYGVTVTCLCPGYTKTAFHGVAGMRGADATPFPEMTPEGVARVALRAVAKGRAVAITHPLDALWIESLRLVPRAVPRKLAAALFRKTQLR